MTNSDQTSQQPTPDNQEKKKIIRGKLPLVFYGKVTFVEIATDNEDAAMQIGGMFADTLIEAFLRGGRVIDDDFIKSTSQALGREFTILEEGYVSRLAHNAKIGKLTAPLVDTLCEANDS